MPAPSQAPSCSGDGRALPTMLSASNSALGAETAVTTQLMATPESPPLEPPPPPPRRRPVVEPQRPPAPSVPRHPISAMQDAFAESLLEATQRGATEKPRLRMADATTRREQLLDQAQEDPAPGALWRRRPGQECHEMRRLMAQVSFGIYLLLDGLANSQLSVVSILQVHIDEIDELLETTLEDIGLATKDIGHRIDLLKLPMDNMDTFRHMLVDEDFRQQILDGNQKIEHIVSRTHTALAQSFQDIDEGLCCTREFMDYLTAQQNGQWRRDRPDVTKIFEAMKGNTDGWHHAFLNLQTKSHALEALMTKLNQMVAENGRLAVEVSQRTIDSMQLWSRAGASSPGPSRSPRHSPRRTPLHSPQCSNASSLQSRTTVSSLAIPDSPPRISLRLSAVTRSSDIEHSYFDIPMTGDSVRLSGFNFGSMGGEIQQDPTPDRTSERDTLATFITSLEIACDQDKRVISSSAGPEDVSERPAEAEDGQSYVLQPRTYTPQPPSASSPTPSMMEKGKQRSPSPQRRPVTSEGQPHTSYNSSTAELSMTRLVESPTRHRVASPQLQVASPVSPVEPSNQAWAGHGREETDGPVLTRPESSSHMGSRPQTSLRQRVSLRANPPESIQVPPPNGMPFKKPVLASPQKYPGPDSAYGSDIDRSRVNSLASQDTTASQDTAPSDLSPPPLLGPTLLPTPHSDQQYFRPVLASPHSPLQQRPRTSDPSYGMHAQQNTRNQPSAMGMSTLSNVTTMNHDTGTPAGAKTLKKKRSAFKWLKKAFSLDEEERVVFEAKKRDQAPNLYYQPKSAQFLDGKRITSRSGCTSRATTDDGASASHTSLMGGGYGGGYDERSTIRAYDAPSTIRAYDAPSTIRAYNAPSTIRGYDAPSTIRGYDMRSTAPTIRSGVETVRMRRERP